MNQEDSAMYDIFKSIRFRLLCSLAVVAILGGILFNWVVTDFSRSIIELQAQRETDQFRAMFDEVVREKTASLRLVLETLTRDEDIVRLLADRDREGLINDLKPVFEGRLKPHFGVTQFQFHLPSGVVLVRLHDVEHFGDDLSGYRPMVEVANQTKTAVAGFELGQSGLSLWVVHPVFYRGKHIGTVEFGTPITVILQKLTQNSPLEFGVAVDQGIVDRLPAQIPRNESRQGKGFSYLEVSRPGLQQMLNTVMLSRGLHRLRWENQDYWITYFPLSDFRDREIGRVAIASDMTRYFNRVVRKMLRIEVLIALFSVLFIVALYFILNRYLFDPLKRSIDFAREIEAGHLNHDFQDWRVVNNEIGQLQQSLFRMGQRVMKKISDLKILVDTLVQTSQARELDDAMQAVVKGAKQLTQAKYAALSVFNDKGRVVKFFTEGMSQQEQDRIGEYPQGKGLLGYIHKTRKVLRVEDLSRHPHSAGFPAGHPPMKSLLAVPIIHEGKSFGNLYLTDKNGQHPFDEDDEEVVVYLSRLIPVVVNEKIAMNRIQEVKSYLERETQKILQIINRIAEGDFRVWVEAIDGQDDIAQIRKGLHRMIVHIRKLIRKVKDASGTIASVTTEISSSTEELAAASQQQTLQTKEVAAAAEEMARTNGNNSQRAQQTARLAQQNGEISQRGMEIVQQTVEKMHQIAEVVEQASRTIEKLGQSSNQIGEIVSLIDEIAEQTNLLALNAAIEAARAGEQGKGFAVVADEVRKLAERTSRATKRISQMIENIQSEAAEVVRSIESGTMEVKEGISLATQAGKALEQISQSARNVLQFVEQIAGSSNEQAEASEQISRNVENISQVQTESAAGISEIARSAADLNRMTEYLNHLVEQFKVEEDADIPTDDPAFPHAQTRAEELSAEQNPGNNGKG